MFYFKFLKKFLKRSREFLALKENEIFRSFWHLSFRFWCIFKTEVERNYEFNSIQVVHCNLSSISEKKKNI